MSRRTTALAGVGAIAASAALLFSSLASATHDFPDVADDSIFHDDISWLASVGVTGGYTDGTYRPRELVSRQTMATFMRRLAGHDPNVAPMVDSDTVDGYHAHELLGSSTVLYYGRAAGPVTLTPAVIGPAPTTTIAAVTAANEDVATQEAAGDVFSINVPAGTYLVSTSFSVEADAETPISCLQAGGENEAELLFTTQNGFLQVSDTYITEFLTDGTITLVCLLLEPTDAENDATFVTFTGIEIDALVLTQSTDTGNP